MSSVRILLRLRDGRRLPVDPEEIFFVESEGGDTWVRMRGKRRLREVRTFGELIDELAPHGFVRIHRGHAVNLLRVREIRPSRDGGWEVRLDPPVNRVLPVSRRQASDLFAAYGEGEPGG